MPKLTYRDNLLDDKTYATSSKHINHVRTGELIVWAGDVYSVINTHHFTLVSRLHLDNSERERIVTAANTDRVIVATPYKRNCHHAC